jgi:hypothetical protein
MNLDEFRSLAAEHPELIYAGPTTGVKRRTWRKKREGNIPGQVL